MKFTKNLFCVPVAAVAAVGLAVGLSVVALPVQAQSAESGGTSATTTRSSSFSLQNLRDRLRSVSLSNLGSLVTGTSSINVSCGPTGASASASVSSSGSGSSSSSVSAISSTGGGQSFSSVSVSTSGGDSESQSCVYP